jgi:hypothetical protein
VLFFVAIGGGWRISGFSGFITAALVRLTTRTICLTFIRATGVSLATTLQFIARFSGALLHLVSLPAAICSLLATFTLFHTGGTIVADTIFISVNKFTGCHSCCGLGLTFFSRGRTGSVLGIDLSNEKERQDQTCHNSCDFFHL